MKVDLSMDEPKTFAFELIFGKSNVFFAYSQIL